MPILQFMPWCPLDRIYKVGGITLIPFEREKDIPLVNDQGSNQIKRILAAYKDLRGLPVSRATLIQFEAKDLLEDLTNEERQITNEFVELACFSALAVREYFGSTDYCNAEHFTYYGQGFTRNPDYVTLQSKRATGHCSDMGRCLSELFFSKPVHCSSPYEIKLDESLLHNLCNYRGSAKDWGRFENAISLFNMANSDNISFHDPLEWVLLSSAFERLLGANGTADDLAEKFAAALVPNDSLFIKDVKKRTSSRWKKPDNALRLEWMREFYSVRGDFAHGKLQVRQPMVWSQIEHLALAKIVFPLVVRSLLARNDGPPLDDKTSTQVEIFEELAEEPFLQPPPDQNNSSDIYWNRLLAKHSHKNMYKRVKHLFEHDI